MRPPQFTVAIVTERGRVRVAVTGELDMATAPALVAELDALLEVGFTELVVDLTRLEFIDSTGLRGLLQAGQRAHARGARLDVVGAGPAVRRAIEITGLDQVEPFAASGGARVRSPG
jgi:anti-sigma B factor antagonist